jgi:hypothetical protein
MQSKKTASGKLLVGVLSAVLLISCGEQQSSTDMKQTPVERGKYLVTIGGCNDCHTPKVFTEQGPVLDEKRLLSGHPADESLAKFDPKLVAPGKWILFNQSITAAAGPWGISYAANLTPDNDTGIGLWEEKHFIGALRNGNHMGEGRPILPPMPWEPIGQLIDADMKAVFAYFKSLPPIKNRVPSPVSPDEMMAK